MHQKYLLDTMQHTVSGDSVEVGSNRVYARTHQLGDAKRNIPARSFLGISDEDKDAIVELISDFSSDLIGP